MNQFLYTKLYYYSSTMLSKTDVLCSVGILSNYFLFFEFLTYYLYMIPSLFGYGFIINLAKLFSKIHKCYRYSRSFSKKYISYNFNFLFLFDSEVESLYDSTWSWFANITVTNFVLIASRLLDFFVPIRKGFISLKTTRSNTFFAYNTCVPKSELFEYADTYAIFNPRDLIDSWNSHLLKYHRNAIKFRVVKYRSIGMFGFKKKKRRSYEGNSKLLNFLRNSLHPFLVKHMLDWFYIRVNGLFKLVRPCYRIIKKTLYTKYKTLKYFWVKYERMTNYLISNLNTSDTKGVALFKNAFVKYVLDTKMLPDRYRSRYITLVNSIKAVPMNVRKAKVFRPFVTYLSRKIKPQFFLRRNARKRFRSPHAPVPLKINSIVFSLQYRYFLLQSFIFFFKYNFFDLQNRRLSYLNNFRIARTMKFKSTTQHSFKKFRYTFHKTFRFDLWFKYKINMYELVSFLPRFFTIHDSASYPFNGCRRVKHY